MVKLFKMLMDLKRQIFIFCCILLSILIIDYIIYMVGGTQYAYVHLMYIPIIIAVYVFGIRGGITVAFIAGISLGPYMPQNVAEGVMQQTDSWVLRLIFFISMGVICGILLHRIKTINNLMQKKAYENAVTGLPNDSKFKLDLQEIINAKKQKSFSLILVKFENMDDINRHVNYEIGRKSLFKLLETADKYFGRNNTYSIYTNELAIVVPECNIEEACIKGNEFLQKFTEPFFVDSLPVYIILKSGIVNYPLHGTDANDLYKKMGKSLGQAENVDENIAIYDKGIADKNIKNYNTLVSLYNAIGNDMFTLVYQPKVNLRDNEIVGVEALLRYNGGPNINTNIAELIKIAEDAGFVNEITNWVIKNVIIQMSKWQEEGIKIKVAINISSKDLKDNSIIKYANDYINLYKIDPTMLEYEITERTILLYDSNMENLLKAIKQQGLSISLDDYGTGYNSLLNLTRLPIDYIKIDKYFIDNITDIKVKSLIANTIKSINAFDKEVIAEGAETKEQIDLLMEIGCNIIQGYYISKPLPPEKLMEFIQNFLYIRKI